MNKWRIQFNIYMKSIDSGGGDFLCENSQGGGGESYEKVDLKE